MRARHARTRRFALSLLVLTAAIVAPAAFAQDSGATPLNLAAITGDNVYVRSDYRFYPFGKLQRDDVVNVLGESNGWARVAIHGPAFQHFFGYVKHPGIQTSHLRIAPDGKTAITLGRTEIIAPNLNDNNDPEQSWKALVTLPVEQELTVLATFETAREVVYKVTLPPSAQGWVSTSYLRPATPEEAIAWQRAVKAALAKAEPEPVPDVPAAATIEPLVAGPALAHGLPVHLGPDATGSVDGEARGQTSEISGIDVDSGTTSAVANPPEGDSVDAPAIAGPEQAPSTPTPEDMEKQLKALTLADLEAALRAVLKEKTEAAEIAPLRERYLAFAEYNADRKQAAQYARARAEQLALWQDAQERLIRLVELKTAAREAVRHAAAVQSDMEARAEYAGVGRLDASTIYDGQRLPKLLRLRDAATGRTLAYLQPGEPGAPGDFSTSLALGRLVGVVGEKTYDGGLRLHVITPRRIDILAAADE